MTLASLYAIADRETLDERGLELQAFAEGLRDAGVRLLQYRDKVNGPQEILRAGRAIAEVFRDTDAILVLNDRADLASLLGWGVHVGQGDLPVKAARKLVGGTIVGVSTHDSQQVTEANLTSADYVAIGPVFATSSKQNAEPTVGLEGIRCARALTNKPLVAIGGISIETAAMVRRAGADCLAVIGAICSDRESSKQAVTRFLELSVSL